MANQADREREKIVCSVSLVTVVMRAEGAGHQAPASASLKVIGGAAKSARWRLTRPPPKGDLEGGHFQDGRSVQLLPHFHKTNDQREPESIWRSCHCLSPSTTPQTIETELSSPMIDPAELQLSNPGLHDTPLSRPNVRVLEASSAICSISLQWSALKP